ncbi:sporulation transcriptional regulator SpoIIID [Clostridium botulinum]|uniref:sporulation transcriptional regulator SpoIIID n=1 Tax=Clostridium botulinum TaxID=1491 RepID=UPI0013F86DB2|nr:sporulation transcriptional regulator SpoIIID [Clostridium botulinum]MBY6789230.1 sporulation transcriptional regulator SpoIIID [Clostridium botulinum]MBY6946579.1 sporulation transcriptional regulator SpoIIID [Clostridium botulinum]MBY7020207.1 sporulation transcriptional regulator SpoIIID [Clostridium botulinum]NFI33204.1 sporulation transcriptional regulator SpoIIID [Clostridium botulinum]
MKDYVENRVKEVAEFTVETKSTVRNTAKTFMYSKSTVYKDLTERLSNIDPVLYDQVHSVLAENKAERHIRGGKATQSKFKGMM